MAESEPLALDEQDPPHEAGPAPAVPEPAPFGPEDVVPCFRKDLHVERGATPALFDVVDPATGRRFTLYEFELALARLLDGRRKAAEVVQSGGRLGIPMDVTSLYKFVRQMWHYGFLAPPRTADALAAEGVGEAGTWERRDPWDEETRTLFQTGQRLMRLGRNADAAAYFEAVLDGHPGNAEATEMLAMIARGQSLAAIALGEDRPGAAASGQGPAAPASATASAPPRRRRATIAVVVVGLAVAALAAIAVLVPPGPPQAVLVPTPAPAPVASPAPPPPPPPPAWRTAPVERRTHPPVAELLAPDQGELSWDAPPDARVEKGEKVGELRVTAAAARGNPALAKRVAELEKLAAKDPVYREFLARARRDQRAATRRAVRAVPIAAPEAGLLARAPGAAGQAAKGERLARILDPARWTLAASLDGPEPPADAACEAVGDAPGDRAPCRVGARTRAGERTELLVEVAATDAPWLARAASLWVKVAPPGTPRLEPVTPAPPEPPR